MRAHRVPWCFPLLALVACEYYPPAPCEAVADAELCRAAEALGFASGVQIADASAPGSGTVGQTGMVPRNARVNLAFRSTLTPGVSPRLGGSAAGSGGASYVADPGMAAMLAGEVAARVFDGFDDRGRAGGIDILSTVGLLVTQDGGGLRMNDTPFVVGLGARVGVLGEARLRPALSLTVAARAISPFSLETARRRANGGVLAGISVTEASVSAIGGRVTASKQFGSLGISAGGGVDSYDLSADYTVSIEGPSQEYRYGDGSLSETRHRSIAFLGASYQLGRASIGAELGRLWGGGRYERSPMLAGPSPTRSRTFLSAGLRFTPRFMGTP